MKKFNRALTANEVEAEALCRDDPTADNVDFVDTVGNGCEFYASQLQTTASGTLCEGEVATHCPIACGLTQQCPKRVAKDQFWVRTLRFLPPVLCLTSDGVQHLSPVLGPRPQQPSRRRLGHLPKLTSTNAGSVFDSGGCSGDDLSAYDPSSFTFVLWTRGAWRGHSNSTATLAQTGFAARKYHSPPAWILDTVDN
eukprot:5570497-Prymnesium_polylepis.1